MRFLLVEDTVDLARSVRDLLVLDGHGVDWAATLAEAEDCLAIARYDLILLDIMLPDGDGLDLVRRLRSSQRYIPCLILTARDALHDRVHGLEAGADDYIAKPFKNQELIARIRTLPA